jgi:DnaJ-class molecular chaperone
MKKTFLLLLLLLSALVISIDASEALGQTTTCPKGTAYADGCSGAPAGTAQLPTLLSSYATRPAWNVAGVDYAVGVPAGTTLKDPATGTLPAGVTRDSTNHIFNVSGDNVVISGWDFSLEGGWEVDVNSGSGVIIEDNNFKSGSNGNGAIYLTPGSSNATVQYNNIDGSGLTTQVEFPLALDASGNTTFQYNYIHDAWGQTMVSGSFADGENWLIQYNVIANSGEGFNAGAHGDMIQSYNNATISADIITNNRTIDYNTFIENEPGANTQGISESGQRGTNGIATDAIDNNTFVVKSGATVSYLIIEDSTYLVDSATIENNYIDPSGIAYGWDFVGDFSGGTDPGPYNGTVAVSGNTDMTTGQLLSGQSSSGGGGGGGSTAPWSNVQTTAKQVTTGTNALPFSSNTTAGDLLIAEVDFPNTSTFTSISDSEGNTWTEIGATSGVYTASRLYYAKNIKGGADTVTTVVSATPSYHELYISEYAGLSTTAPLDAYSVNAASASSFTSNSITTTASNDLLYGLEIDSNVGTASSGWTTRSSLDGNVDADENAPTAGSYAFTGSSSGSFIAWIAGFKVAGGTTTTPAPSTTPAPTATLTASPASITAGSSSTLTWSSTNATSCTGTNFTPSGTSGSVSVSPTTSTTYSITCTGAGGTSPAASAIVTVTTSVTPAPTATLSASPASITSGSSSTLTWSSTNATSCTGVNFTASGTSGSVSVSPTTSTTYSITCTGTGGTSPAASATVAVSTVGPGSSTGTWAYVQSNAQNSAAGKNALAFASNTNAGDLLIAEVDWTTPSTFNSIKDSQGNAWTEIGTVQTSAGFGTKTRLYYAENIKGGADTVTTSVSGTPSNHELYISEYSGLNASTPRDSFSFQKGSGSSFSSNSLTTTAAGDLLYGVEIDSGVGSTAAGWTVRNTLDSNVVADENAPTAASYAFTGSSSGSYLAWIAAFKASGSSVVTPAPTATLTASPASITSGSSATLTYSSTNAMSCTGTNFTASGTSGSVSVSPTTSTTYSITCTGTGGTSPSASATVTVSANTTPPTVTITAPSGQLAANTTSTTLSATTNENATCAWSNTSGAAFASMTTFTTTGGMSHSTTLTGLTNGSSYTTYVECKDTYGNISSPSSTSYSIAAAIPTATLTASPTSITSGKSATLTYSSSNATSCTGSGFTASGTSGSVSVSPTTSTTYSITCTGSGGTSPSESATVTVSANTTPPSVPTNLSATAVSSSQINLTWTASTDSAGTLAGYDIYRNGSKVGTSATNSYSDTGLSAATTYTYTVSAYDAAGNTSAQSSSASATTQASSSGSSGTNLVTNGGFETGSLTGWTLSGNDGLFDGTPQLAAGTDHPYAGTYALDAGPVGSDGDITQNITTSAGDQYQVSFWLANWGGSPDDFTAEWNGQSLVSFTNAAAQGYTEYTYTVSATSASTPLQFDFRQDPSEWTLDNVSVVQTSGTTSPAPTATLTASPASITSGQSSTLTWSSSNATSCTGTNFTASGTSGSVSVSPTTSTTYSITCTGSGGSVSQSASVTVTSTTNTTPPSVPAGLSATAVSSSQINLTWTASTDSAGTLSGYDIYRNGTKVGTSATNSYSDTGLAASTQYSYTVSAYDTAGNTSAQSTSASATTQAASTGGTCPKGTTYADGCSGAPSGTAQFPTLLSSYATRPAWNVAGVDYAVGVPADTVLKDPMTINMAGVSLDTVNHVVNVTGNNVVLSGYDFSLEGGWEVSVNSGSGATIEDNNFRIGTNASNGNGAIYVPPSASNVTELVPVV